MVLGTAYYFLFNRLSFRNDSSKTNFKDLQKNIGKKPNDENVVIKTSGKNKADFYNNNRVMISQLVDGKFKLMYKGTYLNGGKKIILDNGTQIEGDDVLNNISKI